MANPRRDPDRDPDPRLDSDLALDSGPAYRFDDYLERLSRDWYADDEVLQRLLMRYAGGARGDPAGLEAAGRERVAAFGPVAAGRLRELAETSSRPENAPLLRTRDAYDRRVDELLGTRELATAEVTFHGAAASAVGPLDRGLVNLLRQVLTPSRVACVLFAAGAVRTAERSAIHYAHFRHAFGQPIADFPLVARTLDTLAQERARALACAFELIRLWEAAEASDFHGGHNVLFSQALRDLRRFHVEPAAWVERIAGEPRPALAEPLAEAMAAADHGGDDASLAIADLAPALIAALSDRALDQASPDNS